MTIIMWVYIILFTISAIAVALFAQSHKMPVMYWMAGSFICAAIGNALNMLMMPIPSLLVLILSGITMATFINKVFYKDRKSPYPYILGALLIIAVAQIYLAFKAPDFLMWINQLGFLLVWGWQAIVSFKAYRLFRKDPTVEDWVKGRYLLWFIYTFAMVILTVRMFLFFIPYMPFEMYLNTPIMLMAIFSQYLVWVMPEFFRNWLNRNYKPVAVPSPAEMMAMAEAQTK